MVEITYLLPGYPDGQQRTEATSDGQPPENANLDCVPRSVANGLTFLTGVSYDGDELKDAVHGQGWEGYQAASDYVAYCRARGVLLFPVRGTPEQLVARSHTEVGLRHPVLATIPSLWGLGRAGARAYCARLGIPYTTHVVSFCGTGPGALRAANPWIEQWHDGSDAYWADDLEENEIWVMCLIQEDPHMVNTNGLGAGFAAEATAEGADVDLVETFFPGYSIGTLKNGTALLFAGGKVTAFKNSPELCAIFKRAATPPPVSAPANADPDGAKWRSLVNLLHS